MTPDVRISGLVEESIVDGPGLRFVVFTQGCPHHCPGCHNPETHDPEGGILMHVDALIQRFHENPLLSGVTFSGGEPFLQPMPLCHMAEAVMRAGKTVMTYSGYTFEQLSAMAERNASVGRLLELTDILVDGPYVEALRDLDLSFRGSGNQRILDRKERLSLMGGSHIKEGSVLGSGYRLTLQGKEGKDTRSQVFHR